MRFVWKVIVKWKIVQEDTPNHANSLKCIRNVNSAHLEKNKEISVLIERLELVEQIIAEREEIFIAATKVVAGNKTPVVKGTKKRKKTKQHPTPSPTHVTRQSPVPDHSEHEDKETDQIDAKEYSDDEVVLTAEQIAELYEDKVPPEK